MAKLENEHKVRRTKQNVQKAVLSAVGIAGLLAVAVVAPNALTLLRFVPEKYRATYQARTALTRLARKGLIAFVVKDGKRYARLTAAGRQAFEFERERARLMQTVKKKRWDGQWRLVMFDIPERRRSVRYRLRSTMREIGFMRFQDSAWIYPYDCEDFVTLLKAELKIGRDVRYLIVSHIEDDRALREHFKL